MVNSKKWIGMIYGMCRFSFVLKYLYNSTLLTINLLKSFKFQTSKNTGCLVGNE